MIDYYHLHPEIVETKSDGDGYEVKLCTSCTASIKKNEDPPLSIKAGVDFGLYHRIGLEPLSLAERNIISTYKHYLFPSRQDQEQFGQTAGAHPELHQGMFDCV